MFELDTHTSAKKSFFLDPNVSVNLSPPETMRPLIAVALLSVSHQAVREALVGKHVHPALWLRSPCDTMLFCPPLTIDKQLCVLGPKDPSPYFLHSNYTFLLLDDVPTSIKFDDSHSASKYICDFMHPSIPGWTSGSHLIRSLIISIQLVALTQFITGISRLHWAVTAPSTAVHLFTSPLCTLSCNLQDIQHPAEGEHSTSPGR